MSQIGSAFMSFATTAAFAFPSPWGVLGSAGLAVMHMFTGSGDKQENPLVKALEQSQQQMKAIVQNQRYKQLLGDAALATKEEVDWLNRKWLVLKDLDDERNSASGFVKDLLRKINDEDRPDNSVRRAIDEMDQIIQDDKADLVVRDSAFEVMTGAVSIYLTYLRLRVQMTAWDNVDSTDSTQDLFYGWYDDFVTETNTQIQKVAQDLEILVTDTLAAFADDNVPDDEAEKRVDEKYQNITDGIEKWTVNAEDWRESKPPRKPGKAPRISEKPEDWSASTPRGTHWVKGAKVRYAVAFKNSKGGSPRGPWTNWVNVSDRACPTLVDVPTDQLKIAKTRAVYRQFEGQDDENIKVGLIPDNSTTTYRDDSE